MNNRNMKLITGSALSLMMTFQSTLPIYASETNAVLSQTAIEDIAKKNDAENKSQTETEDVKVVLVSKEDQKTIAVIKAKPEDGKIKAADLKLPAGVTADNPDEVIDIQEGIVPEIVCTSTNKQTVLNLTFMHDGSEIEKAQDTLQVKPDKNQLVDFVMGLNVDLPEGYALSQNQSKAFTDAYSKKNDALQAAYGQSLDLEVNLCNTASLEINYMDGSDQVGSKTIELNEENDQNVTQFDLNSLTPPKGYEFVSQPQNVNVEWNQTQVLDVEVIKEGSKEEQKNPETDENNTQNNKENNNSSQVMPAVQEVNETIQINFVENGKTIGNQKLEVSGTVQEAWTLKESQLHIPGEYVLDQQNFEENKLAGPYVYGQAPASIDVAVIADQKPEFKTAVIEFEFKDKEGTVVSKNEIEVQFTPGETFELSQDLISVPEGYKIVSYEKNLTLSEGVNPVEVTVEKIEEAPEEKTGVIQFNYQLENGDPVEPSSTKDVTYTEGTPLTLSEDMISVPAGYVFVSMPDSTTFTQDGNGQSEVTVVVKEQPAEAPTATEASFTIIFRLADGTVVGEPYPVKTTLDPGVTELPYQESQSATQIVYPNNYELAGELPQMMFIANSSPTYYVTVKPIEDAPVSKTAVLNVTFVDSIAKENLGTKDVRIQQASTNSENAVFTIENIELPEGYAIAQSFENIEVPFGSSKNVELQVAKSGQAQVSFTYEGKQVGKTFTYTFQQTEANQTKAQLKASDLAVPDGYELAVDANTVYEVALGTGKDTLIAVPLKVKETVKEAKAVLRIQYYVQSGSTRQIVGTQSIESPSAESVNSKYSYDFDKQYKLEVPKGYKLKTAAKLGKIDVQYGTMGTIQLEVVRDTAHTSTGTNWQLYAGIAAVAAVAAGGLFFASKKKKK
ncbi:hypothetical protein [Ileibacterium valens]|uniref:Gram-positive cocci surface proteins LPxTG domain-containing protein n=1 Tax=Ileibacterium valens TaxID=1862668 RepID=A0A1U7NI10_9FIRM|nr:hypothetical protein [Ileibacterium valens]OLU40908.1 hypothetical protein BM735_04925 [Erysipelotrichaceae bacterium NYU-BL-F16]OLU41780.1 hypothetical protein BO222_02655 [Ileibacterium valens]OLU42638.1 hypothetical protein BO224_01670 [Erysipelotrichaceae bacterium NYU-BL-E8]